MESFISTGIAGGATHAGLPSADVEQVKVAVLAAGAFGMAMATIAARRKHDVVIYARDQETVRRKYACLASCLLSFRLMCCVYGIYVYMHL